VARVVGEAAQDHARRGRDAVELDEAIADGQLAGAGVAGVGEVLLAVARRGAVGPGREQPRRPLVGQVDDGEPGLGGVGRADRAALDAVLDDDRGGGGIAGEGGGDG
jgi:hypothetical protein